MAKDFKKGSPPNLPGELIPRPSSSGLWRSMISKSFEPNEWFLEEGYGSSPEGGVVCQGGKIMWVYRREVSAVTGAEKFVVGFYSPDKVWYEDSWYLARPAAAARVHWLNGGERGEEKEG